MKRLFAVLLTFCIAGTLSAQIQFVQGDKSNKKALNSRMIHIPYNMPSDRILVVEPILNAFSAHSEHTNVKYIKVRSCDINWKDEKVTEIGNTKKYKIQTSFCTADKLHVIVELNNRDSLVIRHITLGVQNLDVVTDTAIVRYQYGSDEHGWATVEQSPDGSKYALVYSIWDDYKNVSAAKAHLFDDNMNCLWQKVLEFGDVNRVIVTDKGEVVTAAIGYLPDKEEESIFRFNMADAGGVAYGTLNTKYDLSSMALLNYVDGKVLITALDGEGRNRKFTAVRSFVFDIPFGVLLSEQRHAFSKDDVRCFENEEADDDVDTTTNRLQALDYCATAQGGAVLYNRSWTEEVHDYRAGSINSTTYCLGMILFQVDMKGNFVAVTPIRQNNQYANRPKVGADVQLHGNKLYVITNESKEETDEYTPTVPAKRSRSLIKANTSLSIYSITPNGQVAKQMLEKEENALIHTPLVKSAGEKYYFLTGGQFPQISHITLP